MDQRLVEVTVGAEAKVSIYADVVVKERVPKGYRIKALDDKLRKERTKLEARIQSDARQGGVSTPIIIDVNDYTIHMERVKGDLVHQVINESIAEQVGETLCRLHASGIAHGDPTTRNMIVAAGRVYLIDFGLAYYDSDVEARGVDVHVFFQTLEAMYDNAQLLKEAFLRGYAKHCSDAARVVDRVDAIRLRGRYL
ncbi:MAG: Kae1-associated kinase Bud32 [Halobacteriota archaeon]